MPEVFSRLRQQVIEFWKNLEKSQKTRIYVTSVILIAAISASIIFLTRTNYIPLISNADTKEVGEMLKILEEKKIRFKPDGNNGILVDSRDNDKAQAALIQSGYPKSSGITFEDAFKLIKINTTESDKRKIWEHEQESSISAKLKMLDNIKDARVDLALPEPSIFAFDKEQQRATAAVTVTPKSELTPKQIQGIVAMVSRSVEKLNPKDVTVIDNNANILNSESVEDPIGQTNSQYEMTLKKKKELEKNVRDMFNGQFDNFDTIRVVANPYLNFDKQKSQISGIAKPEGFEAGVPVSRQETKENLVNGNVNGVPGTDTNPGNTTTYQIGNSGNSTYNKSSKTENFDYTRTQTEQEKALGIMDPEKSSMAVTLLYGLRAQDDSKLTTEFIESVKKDVSMGTGIPVEKISVNKYKIAPAELPQTKMSDNIKKLVDSYGLFLLLALLAIVLVLAVLPRKKKVVEQDPVLQEAAATSGPRFAISEDEAVPEIELEEKSEVKKQIDKFVKQKPEAVAQLLRNWLADEWD